MTLVTSLRAAGHTITLDGEKLVFRAKPGTTSEAKAQIMAELRERKQEIMAFLVSEEDRTMGVGLPESVLKLAKCGDLRCNGCYSVGPNVYIHPPKSGAI